MAGFLLGDCSMDPVVQQYRERQDALLADSRNLLALADSEKRELTTEENRQISANSADFDRLDNEIKLRERVNAQADVLSQPQGRRTDPDPLPDPGFVERPLAAAPQPAPAPAIPSRFGPAPAQPRVSAGGNAGFRSFGDFAMAVKNAYVRGGEVDQRLIRNATLSTYSNETSGTDGGFAVPPDFRSAIMARIFSETSLIARTDQMTSSSNTITFPVDMTTPWQTSGGVQAYWEGEASTKQQAKIALEQVTVRLHKLASIIPVTDELLEDAPSLDAYLRKKMADKIDFKISMAIVWGNGVGQPLGFMNSPALTTVSAEGGQTADTINATNITKMYARMPTNSLPTAVWLVHPDANPQLPAMSIANQPVYLPPGGLSAAPYGTLLGRPIIPTQLCETVGDLGDIMFVDLQQYMTVTKGTPGNPTGIKTDISIHLWFDQDVTAYRFVLRVAGQPWWSAAITPRDGSSYQSPYIALAAR
jgi:HK97 family phage major capsid protein